MAVCPHRVHAWLGTAGQLEDNHLTGNCFPSTVGSIYKMNWDLKAVVFLWLEDQQYLQMLYIFLYYLFTCRVKIFVVVQMTKFNKCPSSYDGVLTGE